MSVLDLLNSGKPPAQDYIMLGGEKSPGLATITGADSPRKWSKAGGYGVDGASLVYLGQDLSEFDVQIELWEPEHWTQWNRFARVLERAPVGIRAQSLAIVHPLLNNAPLHITQVVIRNVTQFEQGSGAKSGRWVATVALTVYRAAKPALAKVNGTIDDPHNPISDFANDPQIATLMVKQNALGGAL